MSSSHMGYFPSEETRRKIGEAHKGKIISLEMRKKLSVAMKTRMQDPNMRMLLSQKAKKRKDRPMLGHKHSEAAIEKMRLAKIDKYIGEKNPRFGYRYSQEEKNRMSEIQLIKGVSKGNRNPNWQGGISQSVYGEGWADSLKMKIRKRDNYRCQNPFCSGKSFKLHVHHIDHDKENNIFMNLITLCVSCNMKANYNKEYWRSLYIGILNRRPEETETDRSWYEKASVEIGGEND